MYKIEKLLQTEPKTLKGKGKKKVEVLPQIRPDLTRVSNVVSTSKTQNMGVSATSRGEELCGLGRKWQASQQGEYVKAGGGLALLEVQQREALQVYEVHRAHCEVVSSDTKWQNLFLLQPKQNEEANQEHEQGE